MNCHLAERSFSQHDRVVNKSIHGSQSAWRIIRGRSSRWKDSRQNRELSFASASREAEQRPRAALIGLAGFMLSELYYPLIAIVIEME